MKKILAVISLALVSASMAWSQARVIFNNIENVFVLGRDAIKVDPTLPNQGPSGGAPGAYIGSAYSVQLLWKAGTFADLASFLAANPSSSAPIAFFGATGGSPIGDGAGLFDGGVVPLGAPAGTFTFLIQAWYNSGTYSTFDAALLAGRNVGRSPLFTLAATEAPTPAPTTTFPTFTVWVIPEPGTLALGGLGLAALFLLRRRS